MRIELGDSDFPPTAGSGGSFGAASVGLGAVRRLREPARASSRNRPASTRRRRSSPTATCAAAARARTLAKLAGDEGIEAEGEIKPGDMDKQLLAACRTARIFAEVGVDSETGEVRLRRMLGVFAAGRILNAKTARSQVIGGMIWGVGTALHEEAALDARYGYFANHDLAEYHVPVHADIPAIDAVFLPEVDDKANPLKIKGVGELGICGAGAAVANAIYNACGVRVRDLPDHAGQGAGGAVS